MTDSMKQNETMSRLRRLSEIRAELAIRKSALRDQLRLVVVAGKCCEQESLSDATEEWPSSKEVREIGSLISKLREEADVMIGELKDLGVDPELLTINGR